jgi:hypothetical protein
MVQPKYSPEEALQRIKLMMEYDSSKTYTENKVIVENKELLNEEPFTLLGVGIGWWLAGAAAVGTGAALASEYSSGDIDDKVRTLLGACDTASEEMKVTSLGDEENADIAGQFEEAFAYRTLGVELPSWTKIGGGTDLSLVKSALATLKEKGRIGDFCKVRELFGNSPKLEDAMVDELNSTELTWVTNTIRTLTAKSAEGSTPARNQESAQKKWWLDSFDCVETQGSFVHPMVIETNPNNGNTSVKVKFKVKGVVKEYKLLFNGRIYTLDDKYTGKKVVCSGTKVSVVAESVKKKPISEQADLGDIDLSPVDGDLDPGTPTPSPDPGTTPPVTTSRYRTCSGSYSYGCKTDPTGPIGVVQGCLGGLVVDGKFGPKTQAALKAKGYESFTDAEVNKICGKPTEVDSEISAESPADTDQTNTEF